MYKCAGKNSGGFTGMINWYQALRGHSPRMPYNLRLHMPVSVLWGMRDAFVSHEMAHASAACCDEVEVTEAEG